MKCPVCKTELGIANFSCPICGFDDLYHEFINAADAADWVDNVVRPFRIKWESKKQSSPQDIYKSMLAAQMAQLPTNTMARKKKHGNARFEYEFCDDGIRITKWKKKAEVIVVPEHIKGSTITRIGTNAFKEFSDVTEIKLPETITHIEEYAFYNCNVERVTIPDSCTTIGGSAFSCANIREIVFPNSIDLIPDSVCSTCFLLDTVVIMGAKAIEKNAFSLSSGLKNIVLSDSMDYIGQCAFSSCGFEKIILPPKLGEISIDAFNFCHAAVAFLDDTTTIKETSLPEWISQITIYCNKGSSAQVFANKYNIAYKPLSEFPCD